ncbi:restriction endonuclease subunit S [Micromonospora sp. CPCC 205558]|uniref:restriction endonuclease subunit S n=1 Tax=Micromonospora sp. CPCC 205558 TaxID=3122403 RepID=UPI002FF2AF86
MTTEWVEQPFIEVADYGVGRTPARANAAFWAATEEPTPWVTISDMPAYGVVASTKESISGEAFDRVFGGSVTPAGTLIMSFKLTIGRIATLGIPAVHNEAIISIYPKPGMDQRFLGYYLSQVDYTQFQDRQIKGNTLNKSKIDRIPVPVPPEGEQKAIADVLDAVRDLIALEQDAVTVTRRLIRSIGQVVLSTEEGRQLDDWMYERIGDRHDVSSGGTPSRSVPVYWNGGTIPWVKTTEVNYSVITDTSERITQRGLDESAAKILPAGTVVLAMYGQGVTRGKVAILGIDAATNQACAAIQANDDAVEGRFLYQYLAFKYEELRRLAHGGQQQNLNLDIVRDFPIAYPASKETQIEIAEVFEALDRKLNLHKSRLRALEVLFETVLAQLMSGEVRVNDLEEADLGVQRELEEATA